VAINYAPSRPNASEEGTVAGDVGRTVVRHGIGFGLGSLPFGFLAGLVTDVAGISYSASNRGKADVSPQLLTALYNRGADPVGLVAQRTQNEITRRRLFTFDRANPDAVFEFELRRLCLEPADRLELRSRAALAVKAQLRNRRGSVVWRRESAAVSTQLRTWQEYQERPSLVRGDFDALARAIARDLAHDLAR
jgi:hypothetical protein